MLLGPNLRYPRSHGLSRQSWAEQGWAGLSVSRVKREYVNARGDYKTALGLCNITEFKSARCTVSKRPLFDVKFHLATSACSRSAGRKQLSIGELVCRVVGGADAVVRQTLPSCSPSFFLHSG